MPQVHAPCEFFNGPEAARRRREVVDNCNRKDSIEHPRTEGKIHVVANECLCVRDPPAATYLMAILRADLDQILTAVTANHRMAVAKVLAC
jgi:hypothetical protein